MCLLLLSSVMLPFHRHFNCGFICFLYTCDIKKFCMTNCEFLAMQNWYCHSDDMHAFPASFGLKGDALSSTSDVSLLKIVTKTHGKILTVKFF